MFDLHFHNVRQVLATHLDLPPSEIVTDRRLVEDLGLHPLDLVLVVLRLEEIEAAEFPLADLEDISTVGDLVALVVRWSCDIHEVDTYPPPPPRHESGFVTIGEQPRFGVRSSARRRR